MGSTQRKIDMSTESIGSKDTALNIVDDTSKIMVWKSCVLVPDMEGSS